MHPLLSMAAIVWAICCVVVAWNGAVWFVDTVTTASRRHKAARKGDAGEE